MSNPISEAGAGAKSFLICALPRTGSNLLTGMLDSHPGIRTYNELFHFRTRYLPPLAGDLGFKVKPAPGRLSWSQKWRLHMSGRPRDYDELNWLRIRNPGAFFAAALLDPALTSRFGAVGCKVQPWQLISNYSAWQRRGLVSALKRRKGFRMIFIERANALEQFVSIRVAVRLMKWRINNPDDIPSLRDRKIEVDAGEFLRHLQGNRKKMALMAVLFKGIPAFHTSYEQLTEDQPAIVRKIQDFLEVPAMELNPVDIKINPESLEQRISNYSDLRKQLAGTEGEKFLV